ncbi:ABC transporter ATP-binding protein [Varunaivibrio sulfuroxidans]|uniref:Oligopeptide transport system ATP-binding protein n=1 Tax=Varunaivibrio sulfuroxidans TaxID=1773489 RepID=A0A4R3J6U9_9PROT|nr:oligopeptide/dipeptide ABC transporter ATP-binding protein [Varunaivibrio sulfuroxidans]TCS60593.1 oligopeptide transport system ATP-binding protein [Varunaivibrio sulfuroxidans]WES30083.1 ATP-binding cassette domain-containing protein [Varunaivibrio sulfuroxidans]
MTAILDVRDLNTRFTTPDGEVAAVTDLNFAINPGESVGVVGESGSGKTQVFLSIMGLLAKNGRADGSVLFEGAEILNRPGSELDRVRGNKIAMIFQDPMTSLNPHLRISKQMSEVLVEHKGMSWDAALKRAVEYLDLVGIPQAAQRIAMYPHEFSGGMRQRVMIAMSLLCEPQLLIADEPTTALDVTVQAQILELLARLQKDLNTAVVMITHDLGVIAGLCERVLVMYGGRVVEEGGADDIFYDASHPYTQGLLRAMPRIDLGAQKHLYAIPGQPPNLQNLPTGCAFRDRCAHAVAPCAITVPSLTPFDGAESGRARACHVTRAEMTI